MGEGGEGGAQTKEHSMNLGGEGGCFLEQLLYVMTDS